MNIKEYRFDRLEFAGSLGDLGTLLPLAVAMMVISGLGVTPVLLTVGLFYIGCGLYFKLPIPVQPLKVVSAIAIAYPAKISVSIIGASGVLFGLSLLILGTTGLIDWFAKFFTKPIMRGIQFGLALILLDKGIKFMLKPELLMHGYHPIISINDISLNLIIGIIAFLLTLSLITNKRFPAALVLVIFGIFIGILNGALDNVVLKLGPTPIKLYIPTLDDMLNAFMMLVIPQIPLTLGNSVMGTTDTCLNLFGKGSETKRANYRSFSLSMGITNLLTGFIAAMPMCHGAGGVAAHYRFGARTGGANIMIGSIFVVIAVFFGNMGIAFLSSIPNSVLGVMLIFAGIEMAMFIRDVTDKNDLCIVMIIASVAFATTNMGIAFFIGIIVMYLLKAMKVQL